MSYCSDIYIKCEKRMFDEFVECIKDERCQLFPDRTFLCEDGYYLMIWKSFNHWNEMRDDVGAVMNLIYYYAYNEKETRDFLYIRIGEDAGDIETIGNTEIYMYAYVTVEFGSAKNISIF